MQLTLFICFKLNDGKLQDFSNEYYNRYCNIHSKKKEEEEEEENVQTETLIDCLFLPFFDIKDVNDLI